jgi:hypothetical protein
MGASDQLAEGETRQPSGSSVNPQTAVDSSVEWYAHVDGDNQGPVSLARLRQWKDSGHVQGDTLVWRSGLDTWQPAERVVPELFAGEETILSQLGNGALQSTHRSASVRAKDLSGLASEMDRRRGWAFFFGIALVVLASFQIVGQLITVFVAASGSAAGVNTVPALVGAILGIAFAGTVMTAGILLLQFCARVKEFAIRPDQTSGLLAAKRLSALWSFVGIACLIWLVILISFVLVVATIGLSVVDAFT